MRAHPLDAHVRQLPGLAIIELRGDVAGEGEGVLERAYAEAEEQGMALILLNFAEVEYINSKGIALVVVLLRRAMAGGRRLLACGLSDHYREIWTITRLADYITVCTDEQGALDEVRLPEVVLQSS